MIDMSPSVGIFLCCECIGKERQAELKFCVATRRSCLYMAWWINFLNESLV